MIEKVVKKKLKYFFVNTGSGPNPLRMEPQVGFILTRAGVLVKHIVYRDYITKM